MLNSIIKFIKVIKHGSEWRSLVQTVGEARKCSYVSLTDSSGGGGGKEEKFTFPKNVL